MKTKGQLGKGIILSLVISLFLSLLFIFGVFSNIQVNLSDGLYGGGTPRDDIVIIKVDDKSLQSIGRWPWDRSVYASTFEKLSESSVVGVDIAFFEESETGYESLINSVETLGN